MGSRSGFVSWILTGALIGLLLRSPTASAAVPFCGDGILNYQSQLVYNPTGGSVRVRGTASDISVYPGDLCTSFTATMSAAWVMVSADNNSGYAQIGYVHKYNAQLVVIRRNFFQWTKDKVTIHTGYWGNPGVGSVHNYKASRYMTDGMIHLLYDDGSAGCNAENPPNCGVTDFDPTQAWSGLKSIWAGEATDEGTDVPGTEPQPANFTGLVFRDQNGDWLWNGWTDSTVSKCYFHLTASVSLQYMQVWTDPTNHGC
jgi:hypothetical protein